MAKVDTKFLLSAEGTIKKDLMFTFADDFIVESVDGHIARLTNFRYALNGENVQIKHMSVLRRAIDVDPNSVPEGEPTNPFYVGSLIEMKVDAVSDGLDIGFCRVEPVDDVARQQYQFVLNKLVHGKVENISYQLMTTDGQFRKVLLKERAKRVG